MQYPLKIMGLNTLVVDQDTVLFMGGCVMQFASKQSYLLDLSKNGDLSSWQQHQIKKTQNMSKMAFLSEDYVLLFGGTVKNCEVVFIN